MRIPLALVLVSLLALGASSCTSRETEGPATSDKQTALATKLVGYDLRRIRPGAYETSLADTFERVRKQALAQGKTITVLFGADWCEACRTLDVELGNVHPEQAIGHVRIFEFKEEDWLAASRMDELNALRSRWYPIINTYPVFVLLDAEGKPVEEMRDAIDRFESLDIEPSLVNWFTSFRDQANLDANAGLAFP